MTRYETAQAAAQLSVKRFTDTDGVEAVELDITDHLTEPELVELFSAMEDGEHAQIDRMLDVFEGRQTWPADDVPDVVNAEHKAGGADKNRGGADTLRRYWTVGKGAAKIRWGAPGQFDRCVTNLSKYLGPRAKGYCALRYKETQGHWPGRGHGRG